MAKLTSRTEDYSKWYNELVVNADLAENSGVRGCMVIKPYGYAIWEKMRDELDKKQVRITELTEAGNDTHDDLGKERDRADKAEIALAEQNAELTKLRSENSKLREKVERLARAGSTLHGHIDDLKAPY